MHTFNPSIFSYNNILYMLLREETHNTTKTWKESTCAYSLNKLDDKLQVINYDYCEFNINNNKYNKIVRKEVAKDYYVIEDIKVYPKLINNKIIGICNILIEHYTPRKFCVGVVEIIINNNETEIKLLHILELPYMQEIEKNWVLFDHNNQYYFLYKLFPQMIIYKFDINNFKLEHFQSIETFNLIKNTDIINNLDRYYKYMFLTPCTSMIQINNNMFLLYCKKKEDDMFYKYYNCIITIDKDINFRLIFINQIIDTIPNNIYLNDIKIINNKLIKCYGINDNSYKIIAEKIKINLVYCNKSNNFGNQLSKFLLESLLESIGKYEIVYNQSNITLNIIMNGSYIHEAKNNYFIFGTGLRTNPPIEEHLYENLNLCTVRGPLTKQFLIFKNINVPNIFGDPVLLLPRFYSPTINKDLSDKVGLIPHITNYNYYKNLKLSDRCHLISPTDNWSNIVNEICSCRCIISSSLYGLVCSDAYNIPNVWLDEVRLDEKDFKFRDYFLSQSRPYFRLNNLIEFRDEDLYKDGNKIDLDKLINTFPFK